MIEHGPGALSVTQAARYIGVGRTKFRELIKREEIGVVRIDTRVVVPRAELDRYLSSNLSTGSSAA